MQIRQAQTCDIGRLTDLLQQVLELHAALRPDIFISGTTKYTPEELEKILQNPQTPVFVAVDGEDRVLGYAFCILKRQPFSTNMHDYKSLFIDDLCVDNACRGQHIGSSLFAYVKDYAKSIGCYDLTLNVWAGNTSARQFYEKLGMFEKERQMELLL